MIGRLLMAAVVLAVGSSSVAAKVRLFSYDPANAETLAAAGPLTFEFQQGLIHATLLSVRATEAQATAHLRPASEKALGGAGLASLIGSGSPERDLYEVLPGEEGAALTAAFCPGARHAWMSFSHPRLYEGLRVYVLGDQASSATAHLCRRLDFNFHGEWRLPATGGFDKSTLPRQSFPRS